MRSTQPPEEQGTLEFVAPVRLTGDITAARHRGNRKSKQAHARVLPLKVTQRERVRVFISGCGYHGATVHEIAATFPDARNPEGHKYPHQISGRITELKVLHMAYDSGRERKGAAVLVTDPRHVTKDQREAK